MSNAVRIFRYVADVDAFCVTDEYRSLANRLGLTEWHPVVWIGRLFALDNDFGEHWFDNAEMAAGGNGFDRYLVIDPARFQDGRDGPCHSSEFRKRFWTDVLKSLHLSLDLLFDEARQFNEERRQSLAEWPDDPDAQNDFISDLEARILAIERDFTR